MWMRITWGKVRPGLWDSFEELYGRIADHFELETLEENENNSAFHDAGIISGVINSYINLLEKARASGPVT